MSAYSQDPSKNPGTGQPRTQTREREATPSPRFGEAAQNAAASDDAPIRVDGFEQVLAMLRIADPEFRESLLKRLAQRDRELARSLRADLAL